MSCLPSRDFREPICSPLDCGEVDGGAVHLGGPGQEESPPLPCGFFYTTGHCILPTPSYHGCQIWVLTATPVPEGKQVLIWR